MIQVVADDAAVAYAPFTQRLATTANPRHRALLEMFVAHARGESASDLDATMATFVAEPMFHSWGTSGVDEGPKGRTAVRAMYANLFAKGGIGNAAGEYGDILVCDDAIVFESRLTSVVPWSRAKAAGYSIVAERGHYALYRQCAVIVPFDEAGMMRGETAYLSSSLDDCEELSDDQLSPGYLAWATRFAVDE